MAEIKGGQIKPIAFYLPQYHEIPENDKWWGKGFTEWTNVKKATPLFEGHNQPRVPYNNNYYNLLNEEVQILQANIAKKYGLFGFCYYHYWFKNGKTLLEKPAENMLKNKEINIPFCFSWANENWTKNWDGGNFEVIAEQDYGNEQDWEQHFYYLLPFLRDERYITFEGRPVFIFYKPQLIPNLERMLNCWQKLALKENIGQFCFMYQHESSFGFEHLNLFNYGIQFEPFYTYNRDFYGTKGIKKVLERIIGTTNYKRLQNVFKIKSSNCTIVDYDKIWSRIVKRPIVENVIMGGFVDWDNTPRKKSGHVFYGATPEKFEKYMTMQLSRIKNNGAANVIFINAWNEWGESAYLEPDEKNGYGYLRALKNALINVEASKLNEKDI